MTWSRKARLAAAWLLGLYLAKMYVEMGWVKFDSAGFWTAAFHRWGYPPWVAAVVIGCLEVADGDIPPHTVGGKLRRAGADRGHAGCVGHQGSRWAMDGRGMASALYIAGLGWIAFEWWSTRLRRRRVTV